MDNLVPMIIGLTPSLTPPALLFYPLPLLDCLVPLAPLPMQSPALHLSSASSPSLPDPLIPLFKGGMKRNSRAHALQSPRNPYENRRRSKDPTSKGMGMVRARVGEALPEKPCKGSGLEKRLVRCRCLGLLSRYCGNGTGGGREASWIGRVRGMVVAGHGGGDALGMVPLHRELILPREQGRVGSFLGGGTPRYLAAPRHSQDPQPSHETRNMVLWKGR